MAILNALEQMCTWRKEWTVVSRNCIKKLLVETAHLFLLIFHFWTALAFNSWKKWFKGVQRKDTRSDTYTIEITTFPEHGQSGHLRYPQKIQFQNCSITKYIFENYIFKILVSKNINFVALIYSSSESSQELSKSSIICLITFFLNVSTLFQNTCG